MSSQSSISSELSLGSNVVPEEEADDEAEAAEDEDEDASPPALALLLLLLLLPFPLPAAATTCDADEEGFFERIRRAAGVALARGCTACFASIAVRPWSTEPARVDWLIV